MRWLSKKTTPLAGAVAAAVGVAWLATGLLDGPLGMVPGGRFQGSALPCPERWSAMPSRREVELEVRPARPRSVTTWNVVYEGGLFLPADFLNPWKRWPYQVMAEPHVRLRVGSRIFECRADRVEDAKRIQRLREVAARKYDLRQDGLEARTEVWWFEIQPR